MGAARNILTYNGKSHEFRSRSYALPKGFVVQCEVPEHLGGGWFCLVPVKRLVKMVPSYNPPERTDFDDPKSKLVSLAKSIESIGMSHFPIVNSDVVIDGNGRIAIANAKGYSTMMVLWRPWATAHDYAEINKEVRHHTPAQAGHIWPIEPNAVTYGVGRKMEKAWNLLGKDLFQLAVEKRYNVLSLIHWARKAAGKYCKIAPSERHDAFIVKAVRLQIEYKETKRLRDWMEMELSPAILAERIESGQSLKLVPFESLSKPWQKDC